MKKLKRGSKIYLDKAETKESRINRFLECRDGIVEAYEYCDTSGYGSETRLFLCEDTKHEITEIVRQVYNPYDKEWMEDYMPFDSDSFEYLEGLIDNKTDIGGGVYTEVRNYNNEMET